jgi:predicted dehydrogenase
MGKEIIRIGVVGAGANVLERHAPGFQAIANVELLAVCNQTRESASRVAAKLGIPRVYDNWLELIEDDDVDAICIGTWPNLHCPITLAAFERDKHVLTEARMALDADEAKTMLEASKSVPHLVAQLVPAPFTLGVDRTIQELVSNRYLGDLLAIDIRISPGGFVDLEAPIHWRQDYELSGYNALSLGIWYESMLKWVGPATRVLSMTKVVMNKRKDASGFVRSVLVPDHIDVLCDMACGAQAHFQVSAVTGLSDGGIWLYGSEGTLFFDPQTNLLKGGRRGDTSLQEINIPFDKRGKWRVEEEFINCIRGIEKVKNTSFDDGLRYMEFTEAVARSAQSGKEMFLPF